MFNFQHKERWAFAWQERLVKIKDENDRKQNS